MARRYRTTPVGAWYNGYSGLRREYDPFFSYCPNKLQQEQELRSLSRNSCRSPVDHIPPNNSYQREAFIFDKDRASPTMAAMQFQQDRQGGGWHSHGQDQQEGRHSSWDQHVPDLDYHYPRNNNNNGPATERKFAPELSPRNTKGLGEGRGQELAKLNGPRDLELGRLSPRRMTYEPSFHDPGVSPRKIQHWDGDGGYRKSPYGFGEGQGRSEDAGWQGHALDPLMTKMATTSPRSQAVGSKQAGSVFLFIRFRSDCFAVVGQTCQAARTRDLRGEFVGIAEKVYDYGEMTGKNRCGCAVFQLPSLQNAEVFYNRDRIIRQPDFPRGYGDTEIFAIELLADPGITKVFKTFLLSEITLNDGVSAESLQQYRQLFVQPFTALLQRQGALAYVAFCSRQERKTLKRRYFERNDLVTLHLFENFDHFEKVRADSDYPRLRDVHNSLAKEKCSLFHVKHQYCP